MTEQLLVLSRKSEEPLNLLKRGRLIPPFKNYQRYLVEKGAILRKSLSLQSENRLGSLAGAFL